jgi:hypothetical protein
VGYFRIKDLQEALEDQEPLKKIAQQHQKPHPNATTPVRQPRKTKTPKASNKKKPVPPAPNPASDLFSPNKNKPEKARTNRETDRNP